jgi:hypothetical protein
MALIVEHKYTHYLLKSAIHESILGQLEIGGIQVYVIRRDDDIAYITTELDQRIPKGIIVYVPGYTDPFIYFDEMEGPTTFIQFNNDMFDQCLNWFKIDNSIRADAHRTLNKIIIEAHDKNDNQFKTHYQIETQFHLDL